MNQKDLYYPSSHVLDKKPHVSSWEDYQKKHTYSIEQPDAFWAEEAKNFHWEKQWDKVSESNFDIRQGRIYHKWFTGSLTNITYNCIDKHIKEGKGDKVAFYWIGNDGESQTLTFNDLLDQVSRVANVLKSFGVKKGDVVTIYLPMIPLLPITALACGRIGVAHSTVFAGFSAQNLALRIIDAKSTVVVTADGVMRGDKPVPLKSTVDEAIKICLEEQWEVKTNLITKRLNSQINWNDNIDYNIDKLISEASSDCPVVWCDAEDPLFLIYTSGSTGKPKGILHTIGGYMVFSGRTFYYTFDYHQDETYFCGADMGWISGISYGLYGPTLNSATQVMFEGIPTYPHPGRYWEIIEKYKVNSFYTAPTAIRALKAFPIENVTKYDLSSLRVLGSVGEPINEAAWLWYYENIGGKRCSIVDTYWMSETGGHIITPLPGATPCLPSSATYAMFGINAILLDEDGNEIQSEGKGYVCVKGAWPGLARTIAGNHDRFENAYFARFPGYFMTGDIGTRTSKGMFIVEGRADDVLNISGHRLGTAELEGAINSHPSVSESAVVPIPHDIKGSAIYAYVCLKEGASPSNELKNEIVEVVAKVIGKIAKPDVIHWAPGLPKTRSGKIMRRILKKISAGEDDFGDISTLTDPGVVQALIASKSK